MMDAERERAVEGLRQLKQVFEQSDVFDDEDVRMVNEELALATQVDHELLAMQACLPIRQRTLQACDKKFGLSKHFGFLMDKLTDKDADLQMEIDQKLEEQERLRNRAAATAGTQRF